MKCYQCGNIPAHHPETTKTKKNPKKENPPDAERRETCVQHQNTDIKESYVGISAGNYFKKKLLSYLIKRRKRKKSRKKSSCVSLSLQTLPAEVLRVAPSSGAADVRCCSDLFHLSALAASSNPLYTRYYPDIMKRRGAHVRTTPLPTTSTPTSSSSTTR